MLDYNDTICAIATPQGIGGISIVKISGKDSLPIIKKVFSPLPESFISHKIYYGFIRDNFTGKEIDEVLLLLMLAPKSYTKEDVVEVQCHGGYVASRAILDLLIKNGCRLAEPGEFTKRAFFNGRIDLTQAEAVINLVNSSSKEALRISEQVLKGKLKNKINNIKEKLSDILANIESNISFEEDVDDIGIENIIKDIDNVKFEVISLIESYEYAKNFFEGINIVIAGMPNAGKSSLLNYILKKDRAIISNIPGTTRDTIEEDILIDGVPVKLIDTAGLRETEDIIENEGVKRAIEKIEKSDVVIYLFDLVKGLSSYDRNILKRFSNKKIIVVGNKLDLVNREANYPSNILKISLKKNINIEKLQEKIKELILNRNKFLDTDIFITNLRHFNLLQNAYKFLNNINVDFNTLDMIAFEIKEAINELGKLTGEVTDEDILDKIFKNFCIGK